MTGRRQWSRWQYSAMSFVVALAVVTTGVAWYNSVESYGDNISRESDVIDQSGATATPDSDRARAENWLVVGSDSLATERTSGDDASQPLWRAGAQRSDTMMLVHLDGDGHGVTVTSIPRDLWVPIPGHGEGKVNAAFSYGGPRLLVQTVEKLAHVSVDHYAAIDYAGFEGMTDAVGGVDVTVPRTVTDSANDKVWKRGRHHLDGTEALLYVRQRHGLPRGDLDRIERQHDFLRTLLGKLRSDDTLTNPARLDAFLEAVSRSVTVDDTVNGGDLRRLALRYHDIDEQDITFHTAPIAAMGRRDGQDVLFLDHSRAAKLFATLRGGDA